MCGCKDTHCCPHGPRDMIGHPARHAIYQRAREIERLSAVPQSVRAGHYLNQSVRKVSDDVAQVATFPVGDDALAKRLQAKQQGNELVSANRRASCGKYQGGVRRRRAVAPAGSEGRLIMRGREAIMRWQRRP
jgi:hypothetical protein